MVDTRPAQLTRKLLGQFLKDPETIKAFENLSLNSGDFADVISQIQSAAVLVLSLTDAFENERVISTDGEVQLTDGGPGGNLTFGLSDTGVTAATYGSASESVRLAINAKGRVSLAQSYPLVTDNVAEGATNLYFTTTRARASISSGTGISYNSGTGVIAVSTKLALYDGGDTPSAFTLSIVDSADPAAWRAAIGAGTSSTTGTVTSVDVSGGTTGLSFSGGPITTAGTITLSGTLGVANGGTGASTLTGYLKGNGTGAFTASTTIPGSDVTGAALTKTDDTNVTLTLGGTPATALLRATSITVSWSGTLAVGRGGTGTNTLTSGKLLKGNGTSAVSASVIHDDGTNIGVGNSSPAAKVDVSGNVCVSAGGYFYTPYNGATNTGTVRAGIQVDGTNQTLNFYTANSFRGAVEQNGNFYAGSGATGMTSGFFYIPAAAGAPTGVPTSISGRVPMYYDTTNNNFYIYNGAWKKVLLS